MVRPTVSYLPQAIEQYTVRLGSTSTKLILSSCSNRIQLLRAFLLQRDKGVSNVRLQHYGTHGILTYSCILPVRRCPHACPPQYIEQIRLDHASSCGSRFVDMANEFIEDVSTASIHVSYLICRTHRQRGAVVPKDCRRNGKVVWKCAIDSVQHGGSLYMRFATAVSCACSGRAPWDVVHGHAVSLYAMAVQSRLLGYLVAALLALGCSIEEDCTTLARLVPQEPQVGQQPCRVDRRNASQGGLRNFYSASAPICTPQDTFHRHVRGTTRRP